MNPILERIAKEVAEEARLKLSQVEEGKVLYLEAIAGTFRLARSDGVVYIVGGGAPSADNQAIMKYVAEHVSGIEYED